MKSPLVRFLAVICFFTAFAVSAKAYEYFSYTANTGSQTVGSTIDLNPSNITNSTTIQYPATGANIMFENWDAGRGYMELTCNTNVATGWYNVGYVWSTGADIYAAFY